MKELERQIQQVGSPPAMNLLQVSLLTGKLLTSSLLAEFLRMGRLPRSSLWTKILLMDSQLAMRLLQDHPLMASLPMVNLFQRGLVQQK